MCNNASKTNNHFSKLGYLFLTNKSRNTCLLNVYLHSIYVNLHKKVDGVRKNSRAEVTVVYSATIDLTGFEPFKWLIISQIKKR